MKETYGNCDKCPLVNQTLVGADTNVDRADKVRLLIFAEAPANEEIKQGIPLVGKAGKIFREAFNGSGLNEIPHCISNVVLCSNIDENGKTNNPPDEAMRCCENNWKHLVNSCDPEIILIMGAIPMKMFGIADAGITKLRGDVYRYDGYNVFLTLHPSYIARKGGIDSETGSIFKKDFSTVKHILDKTKEYMIEEDTVEQIKPKPEESIHTIKIPDKYYTDEYMLFDIQYIKDYDDVLYIFKDKDGHKQYHTVKASESYYYYTSGGIMGNCPTLRDYKDVNLEFGRTYDRLENVSYFEADIRNEIKHSIDYRYLKPEEPKYKINVQYMDIEVFGNCEKSFPDMEKADRPINAISFKNKGDLKTKVFILKTKHMDVTPIEDADVVVFDNERKLLKAYFKEIVDNEIDIITGWNIVWFDIPYLFNRCKRIDVDVSNMSPIRRTTKGYGQSGETVFGLSFVDMLDTYKKFSENKREMYKLDFICKLELGEGKIAYEGTLDTVYMNDINKFIEYSKTDTMLLEELDLKLKHIDLLNEMITICSTTYSASRTTMGFLDPMIISYAKKKGFVCRDALRNSKVDFVGAYVKNPTPGIHDYVIDLDFTSLYPSIILSCNIDTNTYIGKISSGDAYTYLYNRDNLNDSINITYKPWMLDNGGEQTISKTEFLEFLDKYEGIVTISGCIYCGHDYEHSFLNEIISFIWDSRSKYKGLRKEFDVNTDGYNINHNRQWAYKILMNSIYGVLGNENFRMYHSDLAETVTTTGQELIRFSLYHTDRYLSDDDTNIDFDFYTKADDTLNVVLYSDTDSIFCDFGTYLKDKGLMQ